MKARIVSALLLVVLVLSALPAAAAFKLPAPEKFILKNGITVYYLKSTETPLISLSLMLRGAGSAQEPADLEGVANMTATLLLKGTTTKSADVIAEDIGSLGARLNFSCAEEYAGLGIETLSEHFPKLLAIAADALMNPAFKEDEFAKERKTRLDGLKSVKDNPALAVRYYFAKAYYGTHPLGHMSSGSESSLQKMTAGDVAAYFKKYYGPAQAITAVVGNIERARLRELLDDTLGKWTGAANVPASPLPSLPKPKGVKLLLIDKPDATQAYWILGASGYAQGDPIDPKAEVMNTLFGGRFTSWLSTELRIKRGLTYGASSDFQTFPSGGTFTARSYTKNDKIGEMLQITFDLLKKARAEGFAAEEVESARNYIQGQFPPTLETNGSKAGAYARLAFDKLGFDYYDKFMDGVAKTTVAEAKGAARLLPEKDFVLVVVGKAAEIKEQLAKFGTWTEKKIIDPGF